VLGILDFTIGFAPLRHPLINKLLSSKEGKEVLERGKAPLLLIFPLPFLREGGQGDRLPNDTYPLSLASQQQLG